MSDLSTATEGLRQRNAPLQTNSVDEARKAVLELNAAEAREPKDEKHKKTFGRTPDGTVFTVPFTHDMVTQLLSPTEPKNLSDLFVLFVLGLHITLLWALPSSARIPVFAAIFLTWRAGYNVGIGYLLHVQSQHQLLVRWARKYKVFANPKDGSNPHPQLYNFLKRELETKIPKDYNFDTAPIEYNTWLVFRRVVDLILMCDFVSYILFAFACGRHREGEMVFVTVLRWSAGLALFAFNLWVKLDAHRVVKDFAWYWGDFFYLIDQELTFDGVFEMAPHPMYSIGYVGYYGISLIAASYKVLFVSIIAHAAQFAFLVWVENPHIQRTYNSPPPRTQFVSSKTTDQRPSSQRNQKDSEWPLVAPIQPSDTHNLLGLQNMDLYRTTDSAIILIHALFFLLMLATPSTRFYQTMFCINAALWRFWYSAGLGFLLNRQSSKKNWTRHFLKYGESTGEAWRQWKGTYHLSMTLCYASFVAAAWKMYSIPPNWDYGLVMLKHVIGAGLVALQIWVSFSIYEQLGEFGWFFGDFFFDHSLKLTYGGIYRFLNNPERVLGLAGVWGIALITSSKAIFSLALLSHILSLMFIQFVERPHMQKLYGRQLRQDAGLVRSLRRSLPPPLQQWQDGMDKMLTEAFDIVEQFLDAARPKFASGVNHFVSDTKDLFQKYPARISITKLEPEIVGLNPDDFSLEIEAHPTTESDTLQIANGKEGEQDQRNARTDDFKPLFLEYGAPIKVKWRAPINHSKKDWIGLYMVSDNKSREKTEIGSAGRWIATNAGEYGSSNAEMGLLSSNVLATTQNPDGSESQCMKGEVVFSGDKLWWTQGVFEFRYHHNGKHNVMAVSLPFEVRIPRFNEEPLISPSAATTNTIPDDDFDLQLSSFVSPTSKGNEAFIKSSIEQALLPVVQNCFDRDPEIAPSTPEEMFGALVEREGKYAKRVVYAIQQMFGIELAPQVVKADGKVENLAWRIWQARKVLAPYVMWRSNGTVTPAEGVGQD